MRWVGFLNSDVHPAFKPIIAPVRFLSDPGMASALADTARTNIRTYLGRIDKHLEDRDWLADHRSVADPYLFVVLRWAARLKLGLDDFPNLKRFSARMYDDPAVHAVLLAENSVLSGAQP